MSAGISGFQGTEGSLGKKSGGDGAVGTPVPIPNTEVKHRSGEGSSLGGENSAPPGFFPYMAPSSLRRDRGTALTPGLGWQDRLSVSC